jgi:hypothetical protein
MMTDDFREQLFTRSPEAKGEAGKASPAALLEGGEASVDEDKPIDESEEGGINSLDSRANQNKALITEANQ